MGLLCAVETSRRQQINNKGFFIPPKGIFQWSKKQLVLEINQGLKKGVPICNPPEK